MDTIDAQRVIESLRKGIPPYGYVRYFTVGREPEISQLTDRLRQGQPSALLLKANYGSGKTHLLRFIREVALAEGYAVSSVTLDSQSAVRFNRMDQILGAIWRGLEIPSAAGHKGVRPFFNLIHQHIKVSNQLFWLELTNRRRWDFSDKLDSPAIFIALRAWLSETVHDLVEDWLFEPWEYKKREELYQKLIGNLRSFFRDPRSDRQFYADDVFLFRTQGYSQSWAALRDIHTLAQALGLKGLIILFDEFEDVIYNLNNINWQESAFRNLFKFHSGKQFPGMTYFAVTPGFVENCKELLLKKNRWDYDYSRFDLLPTFQMSPLEINELNNVAQKIMRVHSIAYEWEPGINNTIQLFSVVKRFASIQVQDRTRQTICEVVKVLDNYA